MQITACTMPPRDPPGSLFQSCRYLEPGSQIPARCSYRLVEDGGDVGSTGGADRPQVPATGTCRCPPPPSPLYPVAALCQVLRTRPGPGADKPGSSRQGPDPIRIRTGSERDRNSGHPARARLQGGTRAMRQAASHRFAAIPEPIRRGFSLGFGADSATME